MDIVEPCLYQFHHVCLSVASRESSVRFYNKLGFEQVHVWEAEDKSLTITHLRNGEVILELFCYKDYQLPPKTIYQTATDLPVLGTKHFGLNVDSIEKALGSLVEAGLAEKGTVIKPGRTGVKHFFIKDPDNILVEICEDKRDFWHLPKPAYSVPTARQK